MKQIFLKVYPNGKTTTNASVLNFDRENKSGEIVIDYSEVDFLDWDKQLDLIFSDGTTAFVTGSGNTLTVPLLESYLKKGSMTVQPVAKRLVGSEYEKAKWQVVALSVRDSLNVLENDASITPSVAEQWDIRITEVEHDEVLRKAFETIRQNNENARIANENARLVFETYNPIEDYVVGNKVAYNGSSYVCIADSTGNLPTNATYWLLIASKGDTGATGATGATGEQGIPGGNITNASELPFTPTGSLSSTNTEDAINELDTEKAPTSHTHDDRYYTETEVDTALENKSDKLFATNLVTNGDFSNGTTGWSSVSATGFSVVGGIAKFTPTAQYGRIISQAISLFINNKYYTYADVKTINNNNLGVGLTNGTIDSANRTNVLNTSQRVSTVQKANATILTYVGVIDYRTSLFDEIEVYRVGCINLTSIFGLGKEPTQEQMDWLLAQKFTNSWFNGTAELTSITDLLTLVNTKADKIQEAWITPTLLNGFVGVVGNEPKYMKDQFGFVHIKGRVTGGTINNIFVLPIGYRPSNSFIAPVWRSDTTAFGRFDMGASGSIYSFYSTTSPAFLDLTTIPPFKAEN